MADETNQLRVRLVTPECVLFDNPATAVELPTKSGYIEVLYGHAPLMAELGAGDVTLHGGADDSATASKTGGEAGGTESATRYNVSWGFVEVLGDRVTILASDAIKPEQIDVARARLQLERGQKEWNEAGDREDAYAEALTRIAEAEAKIASATEKH